MTSVLTLSEVCPSIVDCEHRTAPLSTDGIYYAVGTPAMKDHVIDYGESRRISEETFNAWTRRMKPRWGDLLLAREAPVGPVVLVPREENVAPGQRTVLLRPDPVLADSRYLYYYLKSPKQQDLLQVKASGSTVSHLNVSDVRAFPIVLPPKWQQAAIAEVLGALDDKIAANTDTVGTIREICRSLYSREAGNREPVQCEVLAIEQLVRAGSVVVSDGYRTKRSELSESGYRIIRVADISAGEVSFRGPDFVSEEYGNAIGGKAGKSGDILLTTKGTVGRLAVVRELYERVVYSPQLCFFRVQENELVDHWYLRYWFESAEFLEQASHRMNNSDMAPYINLADIRSLRITLPPIESQRRLARTLDALESEVGALQEESRTLAATRDLLLPSLMSGKLRVKDAENQVEAVV